MDRFRLAINVDLGKAKKHRRCGGTGIVGYKKIDDPENPGKKTSVPIVCRCVRRRGGVKKDSFDRIAEELAEQVADGTLSKILAKDVGELPAEAMLVKIEELKKTVADEKTDPAVKEQIAEALKILVKEA